MDRSFQTELAKLLISLGPAGDYLWIVGAVCAFALLAWVAFLAHAKPAFARSFARSAFGKRLLSERTFLVLLGLTTLLLRLPGVCRLELNYDESGAILGARTLLHDPRFWLSFENTTLGPVHTYSLTPIGLLGLDINYATTKVLAILVCWLTIWALFRGLARRYGSTLGRIFVLPVAFTLAGFSYFDYVAYNGEHMPMLLLALAYWLCAELGARDASSAALCLAFGAVLGVVPYAKIQAAPIAFTFGAVACITSLLKGDRRYRFYLLGALAPTCVLLLDLWLTSAFKDFWQSYILNNLLYAREGHRGHQKSMTLFKNFLHYYVYLRAPFDTRNYFSGAVLLGAIGSILIAVKRGLRGLLAEQDIVLGWLLFAVGSLVVLLPKNNWDHYLLLLVVPLCVLASATSHAVLALVEAGELRWPLRSETLARLAHDPATLAGSYALVVAFLPALNVVRHGNVALTDAAQILAEGATPSSAVEHLSRFVKPGQAVALWGGSMRALVEVGARLGTRDAHIERQVEPSKQQPYYVERWIGDVERNKPGVVLDSTESDGSYEGDGLSSRPELYRRLLARYALAEDRDGMRVYLVRGRVGGSP